MNELKNKIEAVLFSTGKKVELSLLKTLCDASSEKEVEQQLKILTKEYKDNNSPLMVIQEGNGWKLTLHERYLNTVQDIIPETELTKTVMETLAVIAWKQPVLQSEVIKIRTNKAYDHISELIDTGFITKEKKGRSYLIRATSKFFEYFDVPNKEKLKELFNDIEHNSKKKDETVDDLKKAKRIGNGVEVVSLPKNTKEYDLDTVDGIDVYETDNDLNEGPKQIFEEDDLKESRPEDTADIDKPQPEDSEPKEIEKERDSDDSDNRDIFSEESERPEEKEQDEETQEIETKEEGTEEDIIDEEDDTEQKDLDNEDSSARRIDPELEDMYKKAKDNEEKEISLEPDDIDET